MRHPLRFLWLVPGVVPAVGVLAALAGLGLHRHAAPWAIACVSVVLLFVPPALAALACQREWRVAVLGGGLGLWSVGIIAAIPVFFPGERNEAIGSGLALLGLGEGWQEGVRGLTRRLPSEPVLSRRDLPEAVPVTEAAALVAAPPNLLDHEIALPYDGDGRRVSVPVAFEHEGQSVETWMLLDTGATYTTLPPAVLASLGVALSPAHPRLSLQTANGAREAQIVLLDTVWLGDLPIHQVAIATCATCEYSDTSGLLGLNVTGGYNMMIDADRAEVVFSARNQHNRRLDVSPFVDLSATFTRYPGGRVEVGVLALNGAPKSVDVLTAEVGCLDQSWLIDVDGIAPGEEASARKKLPEHERCVQYEISLRYALWR